MNWQSGYYQAPHDFRAYPFHYAELCQVVKLTSFLGGDQVRVHLTNRWGKRPLHFSSLMVASRPDFNGAVGIKNLTIPAGQALVTSPLSIAVRAGGPLYFRLVAETAQTYADYASTYDPTWVNAALSRTAGHQPTLRNRWHQLKSWFSLAGFDVWTTAVPVMAHLIGDSLVETGMLAAALFRRTMQDFPTQVSWVVDGISGNRLLRDAPTNQVLMRTFGEALLRRLIRHERPAGQVTVASIGGNDLILPVANPLGGGPEPSVATLADGYTKLNGLLAERGSKLVLPTIAPLRVPKATGPLSAGERRANERRRQLNQWLIKRSYTVDTAPLLTDAQGQLAARADFGDQLHLSPAGGEILAAGLWPEIQHCFALN